MMDPYVFTAAKIVILKIICKVEVLYSKVQRSMQYLAVTLPSMAVLKTNFMSFEKVEKTIMKQLNTFNFFPRLVQD